MILIIISLLYIFNIRLTFADTLVFNCCFYCTSWLCIEKLYTIKVSLIWCLSFSKSCPHSAQPSKVYKTQTVQLQLSNISLQFVSLQNYSLVCSSVLNNIFRHLSRAWQTKSAWKKCSVSEAQQQSEASSHKKVVID